jgi:alginate O-acetyltransferase complex protein AlgI
MWITMLTSGFWHGASWTFVIWGGLHAFFLSLERITKWPQKLGALPLGKYLCIAVMFFLVLISWVFFRAQNVGQAFAILRTMFNFGSVRMDLASSTIAGGALSLLVLIILRQIYFGAGLNTREPGRLAYLVKPVTAGLLLAGCVFLKGPGSAFIYFQF